MRPEPRCRENTADELNTASRSVQPAPRSVEAGRPRCHFVTTTCSCAPTPPMFFRGGIPCTSAGLTPRTPSSLMCHRRVRTPRTRCDYRRYPLTSTPFLVCDRMCPGIVRTALAGWCGCPAIVTPQSLRLPRHQSPLVPPRGAPFSRLPSSAASWPVAALVEPRRLAHMWHPPLPRAGGV